MTPSKIWCSNGHKKKNKDSEIGFQKDAVLFGTTQKARSCLGDFIDYIPAVKIASGTLFEKQSRNRVR